MNIKNNVTKELATSFHINNQQIQVRSLQRDSHILVMAPHGGGIEPGTSEIAEAIAGRDYSLYCYEGLKESNNWKFHVTSTQIDEPHCLSMADQCHIVIAVHGLAGDQARVYVGGRHDELQRLLIDSLQQAGFQAIADSHEDHAGIDPNNICNCGQSGQGVQLEITKALRTSFFEKFDSAEGRKITTPFFSHFVNAIRQGCLALVQ